MTHPLTNEKALSLFSFEQFADESPPITVEDTMRTAADWQLEQVTDWLKENLGEWLAYEDLWDMKTKIGIGMFINDLKKAMRPTQEDN